MRLSALSLVALAACGPSLDRADITAPRPFVTLTVDTKPPEHVASDLPAASHTFGLSSTYAFDNTCTIAQTGLTVTTRADAATEVGLSLGPWKGETNHFAFACANAAECARTPIQVHWVADGVRFDAAPARAEDGLPASTSCTASITADALDPDQAILQGSCDNLLGSSVTPGHAPVYGPVRLVFSALCKRPS